VFDQDDAEPILRAERDCAARRRDPALTALVPGRIEQLAAELAMPRERVVAWGFVKAVLSDAWSVEDWVPGASSPVSRALDVAHALWPELA